MLLSQGETIRHDDKRAAGTWMIDPPKVFLLLEVRSEKLTIGPVAHRTEGHFFLLDLWIIPWHRAVEQIHPTFRSDNSEKCVLKELGRGPYSRVAYAKRRNSGCLQLVASSEELVKGHLIAHLDSVLFEQLSIVPQNIPSMDPCENRINLAIFSHQVHSGFGYRAPVEVIPCLNRKRYAPPTRSDTHEMVGDICLDFSSYWLSG